MRLVPRRIALYWVLHLPLLLLLIVAGFVEYWVDAAPSARANPPAGDRPSDSALRQTLLSGTGQHSSGHFSGQLIFNIPIRTHGPALSS